MTIRSGCMQSYDALRLAARLSLALAAFASTSTLGAQGAMRELTCRGKAGIVLKVDQDPSPRDPRDVVMVLEYARSTATVRDSLKLIEPGTCTWNPLQHPGVPAEPGRVRFDVRREAQPWPDTATRKMDTTAGAARFFPDPITLPRYLNDPRHYWNFFVDDATNLSTSFGALFDAGQPTYSTITGRITLANDVRRDLVCRGGSAGLRFGGGTTVGDNLARVVLGYRVSATVPGPAGYGLSPGSCAWTDRTAMPKEPGQIVFRTARNAQIRQAQSGSIDRTPTAAERYADVFTIPAYLTDPQHYWTFSVMSKRPDSALTNGPWKRDLSAVVATGRSEAPSTRVSLPSSIDGEGVFRPGGAGSTSVVQSVYDIKNVSITPLLENAVFYFQAAPSITPTVTITAASGGPSISIPVQGTSIGTLWRYLGESKTPLARNTTYNYTISAPASGNARANTKSGTFRTLGQRATISVSQIYLISDGDKEGNGEVLFDFDVCGAPIEGYYLAGVEGAFLSWGTGAHRTYVDLKSTAEVPDRFQLRVLGIEDDRETVSFTNSRPWPKQSCRDPLVSPGRNIDVEWNSLAVDFDLSKYQGAKAGDTFVKRSRLPTSGGSLMFEIRGSFQVTRQ